MNNIWNEISEESKNYVRELFNSYEPVCANDLVRMNLMDDLFGKDNLNPKPQIKTWKDYEKTLSKPHTDDIKETYGAICFLPFMNMGCNPVVKKMIATYEIAILIDLGYGGMITDEEWTNINIRKYCIVRTSKHLRKTELTDTYNFIAFHTKEQRDEFYNNNEQLCKDYYMI